MKHIRRLLMAALLLVTSSALAYDFEVDGIYYSIRNSYEAFEVAVTYRDSPSSTYSGNIVIPTSVVFEGRNYSVTSIGEFAFRDCPNLTSIVIPNSVTIIDTEAFFYCPNLISVIIPNSVKIIGYLAFGCCGQLSSVIIGSNVTSIGGNPFSDTAVYFDESNWIEGVFYIDNYLLEASNNITPNYVIKEGTKVIAAAAFSGVCALSSISIPNTVINIGNSAFAHCTELTSIVIPNSITYIGNSLFDGCTGLNSVIIPNSVTSIGMYAFQDCSGLTSFIIPNSVTSIGWYAFCNSGLKSIAIPNSLTYIGSRAFEGCSGLNRVIVGAVVPPRMESMAFPSTDIPLYVPCGYGDVYANADGWSNFTNIIDTELPYNFEVKVNDVSLGCVQVMQYPDCESNVATVVAQTTSGNLFLNWSVNGQIASTANPYTFVLDNDMELMANFSGTGMKEDFEKKATVSPNPAMERVWIICESMKSVTLCTIEGKTTKMYDDLSTDEAEIDLADLTKGLYLLRIELQNGLIINKKIIIQ